MWAAKFAFSVVLAMQFVAPVSGEAMLLLEVWEEPTESVADKVVLDGFKEYCLSAELDLSSVASRLRATGAKQIGRESVNQLFSGVLPYGRTGYVLNSEDGELAILLGASGQITPEQRQLMLSGHFAETLPVSADRELSYPIIPMPKNAIGGKSCTLIARVESGWGVVQSVQELEIDGTSVSDWRVRSVEKGPTEKSELASHWFGSLGSSTINMVYRTNQDGTTTIRLAYSAIISGSDPAQTYDVD